MTVTWKSFRVGPVEGDWEPASYNIRSEDGREYGRWRRVLRKHPHGLTVISRYKASARQGMEDHGQGLGAGRGSLHHGRCIL